MLQTAIVPLSQLTDSDSAWHLMRQELEDAAIPIMERFNIANILNWVSQEYFLFISVKDWVCILYSSAPLMCVCVS
jgi:hypothetical protein